MYLLPRIPRAFCLSASNSRSGLEVSYWHSKTLESTSPVLDCITTGDTEGLIDLFRNYEAMPTDITERGETLLHVAIREGQLKICKYLTDWGADPYIVDTYNRSAADLAWDRVLSGIEEPSTLNFLDPEDCALNARGFSKAHLFVLGLIESSESLELILDLSGNSLLNHADVDGRTPLFWAIIRKDLDSAKVLLKYGADTNALDKEGHSALHACGIYGRNQEFTEILALCGAWMDVPYEGPFSQYHGISPLGFAALYGHAGTLGDLLHHLASINHQDHQGRTPLHLAVQCHYRNKAAAGCIRKLLDARIDIDTRDFKGHTATNLAMSLQDIDCLRLLMDAGANPSPPFPDLSRSPNASTILQWTLKNGWTKVVKFLLPRLSLYDRDPKTGDDVLQTMARWGNQNVLVPLEDALFALPRLYAFSTEIGDYDINPELRQNFLFEGLLHRMRNRIQEDLSASREFEGRFSDALEYQVEAITSPIYHSETDPSFAAGEILVPSNKSGLKTVEGEADAAIAISKDTDDELVFEGWHEDAKPTIDFDMRDLDSEYATDSSNYSRRSEGNKMPQSIDIQQLRMRLRREPVNEAEAIEKPLGKESGPNTCPGSEPQQRPMSPMRRVRDGIVFTIVTLVIFLIEAYRRITDVSSCLRDVLNAWLRPRLRPGHIRITWPCWCGKEIYADFPGSTSDMLKPLSDALNATSSATNRTPNPSTNANSNATLQPPPAAHMRPGSASTPANPSTINQSSPNNATAGPAAPAALNNQPITPRFLELCINTGKLCQSLGEIELTRVTSDATLFAWVRKRYREVRGPRRHWTHYLIKPIAMKFVYFGLEHKEKVHIFRPQDAYPTEEDIGWQCVLCPPEPPPPMPSDTFVHYLCYCEETPISATGSRVWLDRLPKKMIDSLLSGSEPMVHGYGLHIVEGLNITAVLWTLFCVLAICLGPLIAYVVLQNDVQAATGAGGLAVSVLTLLWMAAKVSECGGQ